CEAPPKGLLIADVVRQMHGLIQSGKLRAWGVLNWDMVQIGEAYRVAEAEELTSPCAAELAYSVLNRLPIETDETEMMFREANMRIVASYSLYGGLLSGKYNSAEAIQGRFKEQDIDKLKAQGLLERVQKFVRIAHELDCTPPQLALAYCLQNDLV